MSGTPLSIRIPDAVRSVIDAVRRATGESQSSVLNKALEIGAHQIASRSTRAQMAQDPERAVSGIVHRWRTSRIPPTFDEWGYLAGAVRTLYSPRDPSVRASVVRAMLRAVRENLPNDSDAQQYLKGNLGARHEETALAAIDRWLGQPDEIVTANEAEYLSRTFQWLTEQPDGSVRLRFSDDEVDRLLKAVVRATIRTQPPELGDETFVLSPSADRGSIHLMTTLRGDSFTLGLTVKRADVIVSINSFVEFDALALLTKQARTLIERGHHCYLHATGRRFTWIGGRVAPNADPLPPVLQVDGVRLFLTPQELVDLDDAFTEVRDALARDGHLERLEWRWGIV